MPDYSALRTMMVDTQVRPSDVTKFPVIEALLHVPREAYVPKDLRAAAYIGENLDLGHGRVLLEPRTFAKMLDILDIKPSDLILDVGCGYGYSAAVLARLGDAVVAVEENSEMASIAQVTLSENGVDNAAVVEGPLAEGSAKHGPYDVIILEGAVEEMPAALVDQLKEGGRMAAIFMEDALGVVRLGYKIDGVMNWRFAFNGSAPVLPGFERAEVFAL